MTPIARDVMLVGSIPLPSEAQVFETCAEALGPWLAAIPDGEVGDRKFWVTSNVEKVAYRGHPDLEVVEGDHLPPGGRSQSEEETLARLTQVRIRPGVRAIVLTGLRFASVAAESYQIFQELRETGRIPARMRFQVSLPTPAAAVMQFFRDPDDWPVMVSAYQDAIRSQVQKILETVPEDDLVIQWDVATEVRDLLAADKPLYPWAAPATLDEKWSRHVHDLLALSNDLPDAVGLGYHLCFGTFGGWPHSPAPDAFACAELGKRLIDGGPHRVDYVHIPVMPDADADFFRPLALLEKCGSRIFLGMSLNDGVKAFQRRATLAEQFLPDFGIASYCGWGRERPEALAQLLNDLRQCAVSRFGQIA